MHTLHSQMHLHCSRRVLSLNRTRVWAIICHIYILYLEAVVSFIQCWNWNSRIHWPLITSRKNNTWPVQPGTLWSSIFQITPTNDQRWTLLIKWKWETLSLLWLYFHVLNYSTSSNANIGRKHRKHEHTGTSSIPSTNVKQYLNTVWFCVSVYVCVLIENQSKSVFILSGWQQVSLNNVVSSHNNFQH